MDDEGKAVDEDEEPAFCVVEESSEGVFSWCREVEARRWASEVDVVRERGGGGAAVVAGDVEGSVALSILASLPPPGFISSFIGSFPLLRLSLALAVFPIEPAAASRCFPLPPWSSPSSVASASSDKGLPPSAETEARLPVLLALAFPVPSRRSRALVVSDTSLPWGVSV